MTTHTSMQCNPNVLIIARAFLARDFVPKLAEIKEINFIYAVTNNREAAVIRKISPDAKIYKITDYSSSSDDWQDHLDLKNYKFVRLCRFFRNREDGYLYASNWYRQFIQVIDQNKISAVIDEPVATTINHALLLASNQRQIKVFHFSGCWIPNKTFFSFDKAQEKLAISGVGGNKVSIEDHINSRLHGKSIPSYVYSNKIGFKIKLMAMNLLAIIKRKIIRHENLTDSITEFHAYEFKAVLKSLFNSYGKNKLEHSQKITFLFPLHYYPEAVLQSWCDYTRQVDVIEMIYDHLPLNSRLVIKEHPSQQGVFGFSEYKKIRNNKNIIFIRGGTNVISILDKIDAVISFGSTLIADAAAFGIPGAVLSKVHFHSAPNIEYIDRIDSEIFATWANSIRKSASKLEVDSNFANWYQSFIERYCIDGNILPGRVDINAEQLKKIILKNI